MAAKGRGWGEGVGGGVLFSLYINIEKKTLKIFLSETNEPILI